MIIIVTGNPIDGFTFFGLFETSEDAIDWADNNLTHQPWWLSELEEVNNG